MKLNSLLTFLLVFLAVFRTSANTAYTGMRNITSMQLTADMGAGWNLGNTLDAHGNWVSGLETETCWGNPKTTRAMIDEIKKKGFKTIRIPVTWYQHLGSAPNYTIDVAWLNRVEEVVNYAFANDMYAIINIHHDDSWVVPTYAKKDAVVSQISKVWTQIANRFKDYGDYLIFETLNEPRLVGSSEEWSGGTTEGRDVLNAFHLAAVNAIRNTGGNNAKRHLMVSPYGANGGTNAINDLVIPNNDSKVIISWHYYSPYNFVLQLPGTTTWGSTSEQSALNSDFDRIYNKFIKNGRAVVMGEFSPTDKNNTAERAKYTEFVVKAAKARKITPVWWDNGDLKGGDNDGGAAIFNRNSLSWLYPTIADAIINNIGSSNGNTSVWLEAECGTVGSLWNISSDGNASNDKYVEIKSGNNSTGSAPSSASGQIAYNFSVSESGNFKMWARVITPNGNDDSFWVRMDGGSWFQWNNIGSNNNWTWEQCQEYSLNSGSHTLTIAYREDGAKLDKIVITNTGDTPSGEGSVANNCGGSTDYNITVRARGTNGSESIKLTVGSSTVATWTLTTSMTDYSTTTSKSGDIKVEFINDAGGRDVQVDYIKVNGSTHQAETQSNNTGVWQNNSCGGSYSEWIHCNGYIGFSAFKNASELLTALESDNDLQIYPNPVSDKVNLQLSGNTSHIAIYNLEGKKLFGLQTNNEKNEIDMSTYKSGMYILKIINEEKQITKMLIKK